MSSPTGRRRRVHSDLPVLNHAALDGMSVTTHLPSPRPRTNKQLSFLGLLQCCPNNNRKLRHRDGNKTLKLNLFFLVSCCFVMLPLCYIKLVCHVVLAGSNKSPHGGAVPTIPGNERNPTLLPEDAIIQRPSTTGVKEEPHEIPRILLFTHYRDLLNSPLEDLADEEEKMLATNIHHSINIHQSNSSTNGFQKDGSLIDIKPISGPTEIRFLTDEDCLLSLQNVYPSLIPFFLNETQGMFKADICRGSALYETGGIYLDVDVGVRTDLWYDLLPTTEFFTSLVHRQSKYPRHFFQAILGAAPKSPIIYKYLDLFLDHYTHKDYVEGGPLGVILLRRAWNAVYDEKLETPATELYQEVLYNRKAFPDLDPPPTWGVRRACHFVVVARAHKKETVEFTIQPHSSDNNDVSKIRKYRIPLYSRVGGSRMCPIKAAANATST